MTYPNQEESKQDLDLVLLSLLSTKLSKPDEGISAEELLEQARISPTILEILERENLVLPINDDQSVRYETADVESLQAASRILATGLPLGELLHLSRLTDQALEEIAEAAVDSFASFIRDRIEAETEQSAEATQLLAASLQQLLPATEQLIVRHFRRKLLAIVQERVSPAETR